MEHIHRDYNILCDFIHVKEIDGEYTDNHFEQLEDTLYNRLSPDSQKQFNDHIQPLTELIKIGIDSLKREAKELRYPNRR